LRWARGAENSALQEKKAMTNVERGLEACRRRRFEYLLASVRALVQGEAELFSFWSKKYEEEKEKEGLFLMFRELLAENRPVPGFLPESN